MKTALFLVLPFSSHYNSYFGLADSLRKRGYRVVFTGTKGLQTHVETQDFEFFVLHYIDENIIASWRAALGSFIASRFDKLFVSKLYRDFLYAVLHLYKVCQDVKPDEIYIDEQINHYYFLVKSGWPNVTIINSKLPTQQVVGIPPLTCGLPVKNTPGYWLYCWALWSVYLSQRNTRKWFTRTALAGFTDTYFLTRQVKKQGIAVRYNSANAFYDGLIDVPVIHVVPHEMEYPWYKSRTNEQFFFHPYYRKAKEDGTSFWYSLKPTLHKRSQGRVKLLYVSMGTLSGVYAKPVIHFLLKLIDIVGGLSTLHLLISVNGFRNFLPENLPDNVSFYDWVPQQELLKHCDLMITHGGMNSICECLTEGVPMLVYPLNLNVDQPGNAARVVANGWGIKGNLRSDGEQAIRNAIHNLLTENSFRQRASETRLIILNHSEMVGH